MNEPDDEYRMISVSLEPAAAEMETDLSRDRTDADRTIPGNIPFTVHSQNLGIGVFFFC